ncbi:hypothetical protein V8E53_002617 [Lactarius tabidus]
MIEDLTLIQDFTELVLSISASLHHLHNLNVNSNKMTMFPLIYNKQNIPHPNNHVVTPPNMDAVPTTLESPRPNKEPVVETTKNKNKKLMHPTASNTCKPMSNMVNDIGKAHMGPLSQSGHKVTYGPTNKC